jgi:hypothetical protein
MGLCVFTRMEQIGTDIGLALLFDTLLLSQAELFSNSILILIYTNTPHPPFWQPFVLNLLILFYSNVYTSFQVCSHAS